MRRRQYGWHRRNLAARRRSSPPTGGLQARPRGTLDTPPRGAPAASRHRKCRHGIHRQSPDVVAVRGLCGHRLARRLPDDEPAGSPSRLDQGSGRLVIDLGRRFIRLPCRPVVVPRCKCHARGRQCQGPRVPDRLPDREGAGGRQHLRLPDGLLVLRGTARVPEARTDDRHTRRAGAARRHDPGRRVADRPLRLDPVRLRRVPRVHRREDVVGRRAGARPRSQSGAQMAARPPAHRAGLRWRAPDHDRQRRTPLHAALRGDRADRHRRHHLRRRLDPGDLRDHDRSVHRADLERVRDPRPAGDVLPAGRHARALPPAVVRPGDRAGVHRRQDAAARRLQDPGRVVARRHCRRARGDDGAVAEVPAQARPGRRRLSVPDEETQGPS